MRVLLFQIVQIVVNVKVLGVLVVKWSTTVGIANIFVQLEDSAEIVDFIWRILPKIADIAKTVKSYLYKDNEFYKVHT